MSARAALDAAHAVFLVSMGRPPAVATTEPVWQSTAESLATPRLRGTAMWREAERTLQAVVQSTTLQGQALIGEVRRVRDLSLDSAHALVALHGWVEQMQPPGESTATVDADAAPSALERQMATDAWRALEHAVASAPINSAHVSTAPSLDPSWYAGAHTDAHADVRAARTATTSWDEVDVSPAGARSMSSLTIVLVLAVALLGVAGAIWMFGDRRPGALADGVAAYERGAHEVARMAFIRAAEEHPDDPVPLVYLGRLSREEGDFSTSKKVLERAIQMTPPSAMAMREMASTLLAERQPELARRFYVRAVELDPSDRLAQGFLGCALAQLGRPEEAARWASRAGTGNWTACIATANTVPPLPPP